MLLACQSPRAQVCVPDMCPHTTAIYCYICCIKGNACQSPRAQVCARYVSSYYCYILLYMLYKGQCVLLARQSPRAQVCVPDMCPHTYYCYVPAIYAVYMLLYINGTLLELRCRCVLYIYVLILLLYTAILANGTDSSKGNACSCYSLANLVAEGLHTRVA